jgi:hypothetical protein
MLYRSCEWLTQISPERVIYDLKNYPIVSLESILDNLHPNTLEALELRSDWQDILTDKQEFESFLEQIREIRAERKELTKNLTITANYPFVGENSWNLDDLKAIRDNIPHENRNQLTQSATKRLQVPERIAIMHDFNFIKVTNDIRILESKIKSESTKRLYNAMESIGPGAKRLVRIFLKGLANDNAPEYKEITGYIDAGKFFDYIEEPPDEDVVKDEEPNYSEEHLLRLHNEYLEGLNNQVVGT